MFADHQCDGLRRSVLDCHLAIWAVHMKRLGLTGQTPEDEGWSCRDIRNCCDRAWEFEVSLTEAATDMNPLGVANPAAIKAYRDYAKDRLQSASTGKRYTLPSETAGESTGFIA